MSILSNFLHPGRAYDRARKAEEAYYQQAQGMRQPFIDTGMGAGNTLQDMLSKLVNPQQLQEEWLKSYETSPYAKQLQEEAQTGGLDAASAMGLGGSSAALANIQKTTSDIYNKDRQSYLDDMMKKYLSAMGLGESLYGTGANMASQGASGAQQMGQDVAGLEYGKYQAGPNMLMNVLSKIAAMAMGKNPLGGESNTSFSFPGFTGMSSDMFGGS